jgi:5-formyltetrahydrofolate cyclo-ligase
VGYGKGYYDRYLKRCAQDVVKIGFSYFDAIDAIEDINEFDVPLNYCITPMRVYEF